MSPGTQRGALLLEALTAIAVFSIGILGIVALYAQAIRHVNDAQYRSEAAHLAHSLIGRMWADDPAALAVRYHAQNGGDGYAAFSRLALRLPGAEIPGNAPEVRVANGPSAGSRSVTVTVRWQLPGEPLAHHYGVSGVIGRN